MAPAAIGAFFTWVGASAATAAAATAVATAVYVGAAIGAVIGAATSLATGDDILEGAIKGAVIGGVTRGIGAGIGLAGNAGTAAVEAGEVGVKAAEVGTAGLDAANTASQAIEAGTGAVSQTAPTAGTAANVAQAAGEVAKQAPSGGILSNVGNWIEANPSQAAIISQTLGGAAKGMMDKRTSEREIEALMKRDRLNNEITGLSGIDAKMALPTISGFMEKPKWQIPSGGMIWEGIKVGKQQDANA